MSATSWDSSTTPDQKGRIVVVTGSTSGIGKETARLLANRNAFVILAVRNILKGEDVAASIRAERTGADVVVMQLDISSLASVKDFAEAFRSKYKRLDILINNAGIMMCPYSKTEDGFEIQFGTNHLGHFALTMYLLPLLRSTPNSRVVVLSSLAHRGGKLDFADLNWSRRKYNPNKAYFDSKLANLYFAYELARKLDAQGANPKVTAAHPGWTKTELQRHSGLMSFLNNFFAQGTDVGALPTLRAATDEDASPGDYFGPGKFFEMHGNPVKVESNETSHDSRAAGELWNLSEEMTGVRFPL